MSQNFSFPPPPPPPPKRELPPNPDYRGGLQGRGRGRGRGNSRGQPPRFTAQFERGGGLPNYSRPNRGDNDQRPFVSTRKRDHTVAFESQPQSRPKAPPSVPSYDIDFKSLLPSQQSSRDARTSKRKINILGLTPTGHDSSESEDDADDETTLAAFSSAEGLQFEHKGQRLSLRTPAEIAAWVAERRKRFPTQARAEVAKREAEEKRRQWEVQRKARMEVIQAQKDAREKERTERERQKLKEKAIAAQVAKAKIALAETKVKPNLDAKGRAERLRRKAEKAVKELRDAEEQLRLMEQAGSVTADQGLARDGSVTDSETTSSVSTKSANNDDDGGETSSSGSSDTDTDSDGDSGPEEVTSKQTGLDHIESETQVQRKGNHEGPPPCKNMLKFGRCKFGKNCRFSHKMAKDKPKQTARAVTRRKGLYQIMVDKEQEDEMRRALNVIISLGQQGLLEVPPSTTD